MNLLKFSNSAFVLYQILPDIQKVSFLSDVFDTNSIADVSDKYFNSIFDDIIGDAEERSVGTTGQLMILSYFTSEQVRVNIVFQGNLIHINCDKLRPINYLVHTMLMDGNIITFRPDIKKSKENRHRYHLRYYRVYQKINPPSMMNPISQS